MLDVYKRFYKYYRPKIKARFDLGSQTTPYAPGSLGRRKRSGERIQQVPQSKFNQDTMALYTSVISNPTITKDSLVLKTDVDYANYALDKFKRKGGLAPDGVFVVTREDLDELDTILIEEYMSVFG